MKTTFGVATAIIAAVASLVVGTAGAGAADSSACTATSGVTVIVDFTHFADGKIERGCAPGQPANGLIALHAAGFATAGTTQYGDAFVCRIDGLPTPKHDPCSVTPPPTAFWAYWYARPSDSQWTYSALGVIDLHPKPGTIEAFAFGDHTQPGVAPSAAIPTTTTSTTATIAPPATTAPPATAATLPVAPPTTDPPVVALGSTTTTPTTKRRPPRTTTSLRTQRTTVSTTTVGIVERSASGPAKHSSSGSPIGAILAVVIVGGLALGALGFTRVRRRTS